MLKKLFLSTAIAVSFTSLAQANDDGWSGEASLTGGKTTGNTDTEDLSLGLKLGKEGEKWRHKVDVLVDYGKVDNATNRKRWALGYQIERDVNDRTYIYANADTYQDDFGAYENGYFIGAGGGYKLVLPDPLSWNIEAGAGYRVQEARDYVDSSVTPNVWINPGQTNELALRAFSDLDYDLNDNVSLYNDTEILWSDSDTYIWNEVGLNAQLMGNLAARVSYRVDHHTDVPPGIEKTDTAARFGIVYTID